MVYIVHVEFLHVVEIVCIHGCINAGLCYTNVGHMINGLLNRILTETRGIVHVEFQRF